MKNIRKILQPLTTINTIIGKIESIAMGVTLWIMVMLTIINVVCRYALFISTPWADEMSLFALLWGIFLGIAYTERDKGHLVAEVVDYVVSKTCKQPEKVMNVIKYIATVFSLIFMVICIVLYYQFMVKVYPGKSTILRWSHWVWILPAFVGFVLMAFHMICNLIFCGEQDDKKMEV